jgi:hypothetical protein
MQAQRTPETGTRCVQIAAKRADPKQHCRPRANASGQALPVTVLEVWHPARRPPAPSGARRRTQLLASRHEKQFRLLEHHQEVVEAARRRDSTLHCNCSTGSKFVRDNSLPLGISLSFVGVLLHGQLGQLLHSSTKGRCRLNRLPSRARAPKFTYSRIIILLTVYMQYPHFNLYACRSRNESN